MTVFFKVINPEDRKVCGCHSSLFVTTKQYEVGEKFIHHYHKVECIVTKVIG